jgi:putative DNA primase/helicase
LNAQQQKELTLKSVKSGNPALSVASRLEVVDGIASWLNAGCCVMLASPSDKRPIGVPEGSGDTYDDGRHKPGWKRVRTGEVAPPSLEQLKAGIVAGTADGFGIVCGGVSGRLEMLEVEGRAVHKLNGLKEAAKAMGCLDILNRVKNGCMESSPSGGLHIPYRILGDGEMPRNTKLAQRPNPDNPSEPDVLAETRAEGGWFVAAPSGGRTHKSGESYKFLRGGPDTIASITMEERNRLVELFRTLDEMPPPVKAAAPRGNVEPKPREDGTLRPGEDFNLRATWEEVLGTMLGWKKLHVSGQNTHWCRSGKDAGTSATVNADMDVCYVFTSSSKLPAGEALSKFGVYACSRHDGDYAAAARELGKKGYGAAPRKPGTKAAADVEPEGRHDVDGGGEPVPEPLDADPRLATITSPRRRDTWNDLGLARRLVYQHGNSIRYLADQGVWMSWDGSRWAIDPNGRGPAKAAKQMADDVMREFGGGFACSDGEDKVRAAFVRSVPSAHRLRDILTLAATEPGVSIMSTDLDRDPHLVNLANGTLDLRTLTLRPHDPNDLMTERANVAFDPTASRPAFDAFLGEVTCGDKELAKFLQRALGLSLSGEVTHQCLFIHYGSGANGKSTLLDVVGKLLGGYAGPVAAEAIVTSAKSAVRERAHHMAEMAGRRLVVASEPDGGMKLSEGLVKQMTSTEPVTARRLHKDPFSLTPTWKLHLTTNTRPIVKGADAGIWRRVHLVPWNAYFPPERRDRDMVAKLLQEGPGILNWLLAGYATARDCGVEPPPAVTDATLEYREDSDTLGQWIAECCVTDAAAITAVTDLYRSYREWAKDAGIDLMTQNSLGRELTRKGFDRSRSKKGGTRNKYVVTGMRLAGGSDDAE